MGSWKFQSASLCLRSVHKLESQIGFAQLSRAEMREIMKKLKVAAALIFSAALMMGCGKDAKEEIPDAADMSGDAIVINEIPWATEEMNAENAVAQAEEPETQQPEEVQPEEVTVDPEELQEPQIGEAEVTEKIPETKDENKLQIVFLGDSILDGYRNETGIAYLTGEYCNADVYNLAMGGTTAALTTYENASYGEWDSRSLQGVVHAICGEVDAGIMDGYRAGEVFDSCDFSKTDYFVIEYGMNDFLSGIPLNDEDDFYDEYTYVGALRIAVQRLRSAFPDAVIVLCSPNYAQFWGKDGSYLGDGNVVSNGGGKLVEYYRVCGNVSADMHTLFLNAYEGIGLDTYSASEYLEDGIHLAEKGRRKYAEKLSQVILEYEATKNN